MHKAGDLGKRLGVHPNTLRNWSDSDEYQPFLSASAKGRAPGAKRRFTDQDAVVLATIAHHRNEGLRSDQIIKILESGQHTALPELPNAAEVEARENVALVPLAEYNRALDTLRIKQAELERVIDERDNALLERAAADARAADLREQIGMLKGEVAALRGAVAWRSVAVLLVLLAVVIFGVGAVLLLARG